MNAFAKITVYRVLAVTAVVAPYLEFAKDHRRVPLAAAVISFVGLVAILIFVERKKELLPITREEGEKREQSWRCSFFAELWLYTR
jgi:hypothetical protein